MNTLESRLFEHLKRECQASSTGEILTKVDVLRQSLSAEEDSVYPAVVALRNKGLITTHKKGRLGMTVRVLRDAESDGDVTVNFCPNCGRKVPTAAHRFCYNCGEPLATAGSR